MDAFAGLAWDDSNTQNNKNVTLGAQQQRQMTPSMTAATRTSNTTSPDSFGRLAAAGQFQPIIPNSSQNPPKSNAIPISSNRGNGIASPPRPNGSGNNKGDPFNGLFALGGSPNINMSMADRRAHAERERRERERREREQLEAQGAMWDQLDGSLSSATGSNANSRTGSPSPAILGLGNRSHVASSPPAGLKTNPGLKRTMSPKSSTDLFWSMHQPLSSTPSRTSSPGAGHLPQRAPSLPKPTPLAQAESNVSSPSTDILSPLSQRNDAWAHLDALAAPKPTPASTTANAAAASLDPFDLDFLSEQPTIPNPSNPTPPRSRSRTPGDFDFGEREDLDEPTMEDDDILGELSKPIDHTSTSVDSPQTPRTSMSTAPRPSVAGRSVSPPPHIIGQIVEMGFTPQQARQALASTETGLDVQAALDSLLSIGEDVESADLSHMHDSGWPRHNQPSPPPPLLSRTRDNPGPARASGTSTPTGNANPGLNDTINGIAAQLQADKILAQASEIGLNMFSKANAFWNQSKGAVQKAYEERTKTGQPGGVGALNAGDGRPKWMNSNAELDNDQDHGHGQPSGRRKSGFRDDDDIREYDSREMPAGPTQRRSQATNINAPTTSQPLSTKSNMKLLFDEDAPTYISPHRIRPGRTASRNDSSPSSQPSRSAAPPPPRQPPQQQQQRPQPTRPSYAIPETSPAAIASCISARTQGTEHFKLGRYADAESCYSTAIASLPPTHILLTALYTNRAAARLKTGDSGGAVSDCTTSLKLMGIGENMSGLLDVEDGQAKGFKFDGVPNKLDLREQAVKALQRRAGGYELMERWERARADWEKLAGLGWIQAQGKVKEEATRSAVRCRTMVNAANGANDLSSVASPAPRAAPKPKPKPSPRPPMRSGPDKPSEGAKRLREAEAAQEAEENERIEVKDMVDARIQAWKGGKEANVRALIASLETILWPELGWVKVGMHELVTPNQVKIRYTKAIAKVHPDKLKVGNTTVEQRMTANAVFAGLNEAWGSFKQ